MFNFRTTLTLVESKFKCEKLHLFEHLFYTDLVRNKRKIMKTFELKFELKKWCRGLCVLEDQNHIF